MPMPTVVKGAPVASRIPPHENRAKPLARVAPDENLAESPRCSARYENRVPPDPYAKPYRQAGLQARTIHRKQSLRIFRANIIAVGRQTISLGEKCARKADRRKQTAKITQKTEVSIFILPHQSRKSNGTECKYAISLHSRPSRKVKYCCLATYIAFIAFTTKNFYAKKVVKKRRHNDNDVCQFVSNSIFELEKPTNHRRILQKIWHSFFRKKPAKPPDFRESPAKSPETPRKI